MASTANSLGMSNVNKSNLPFVNAADTVYTAFVNYAPEYSNEVIRVGYESAKVERKINWNGHYIVALDAAHLNRNQIYAALYGKGECWVTEKNENGQVSGFSIKQCSYLEIYDRLGWYPKILPKDNSNNILIELCDECPEFGVVPKKTTQVVPRAMQLSQASQPRPNAPSPMRITDENGINYQLVGDKLVEINRDYSSAKREHETTPKPLTNQPQSSAVAAPRPRHLPLLQITRGEPRSQTPFKGQPRLTRTDRCDLDESCEDGSDASDDEYDVNEQRAILTNIQAKRSVEQANRLAQLAHIALQGHIDKDNANPA